MTILHIAAEVAPFVKVGGLADVLGSLPKAQAALKELDTTKNINTAVVMPRYGFIHPEEWDFNFHAINDTLHYWQGTLPHSTVPIFLLESTLFSMQQQVYPNNNPSLEF